MSQNVFKLHIARLCNEAIDGPMDEAERAAMTTLAARKVEELFDVLRIDHRNDHNTRDTPMPRRQDVRRGDPARALHGAAQDHRVRQRRDATTSSS